MAKVFKERLHKGYAQALEIAGKPLVEEKSRYQRIKIFDTVANGRVMTLDDIVQITTRDESAYAEMLTHLPLFEHGAAKRVMIVGGGDLSIADEALKHKSVKEVVLVDIDGRVIELCREHFAEINAKAFKDKRLKIEIADAFEYLGRAKSKGRFDLIVADRPDPVGPGKALFGETFYDRVKAGLEAWRLRNVSDRRSVLSAVGNHRRAQGTRGVLSAIGTLSDGRADLYRRLHGAVLGRYAQARSARRRASRARATPSRARRSRPTITTPPCTRPLSRCRNGSGGWCRKAEAGLHDHLSHGPAALSPTTAR